MGGLGGCGRRGEREGEIGWVRLGCLVQRTLRLLTHEQEAGRGEWKLTTWWALRRSAKEENRKKQEDKKKNAPKKVAGAQNAPAVKMGKAGGAVIAPGRSSAPGKKSAR
jgi:hypothetical protein